MDCSDLTVSGALALPTAGAAAAPRTCCAGACVGDRHCHQTLSDIFDANRRWADAVRDADPTFFARQAAQQEPELMYIGCSDSRVPVSKILGLAPGDVFVQRNVGNQALHGDMSLMACLEFAVKALKVKSVLVVGHYNCGAVKAALLDQRDTPGLVQCWISDVREARDQAAHELAGLGGDEALARLCEINVLRQTARVCSSPVVQAAWDSGAPLAVWGLIYGVANGRLKRLVGPLRNSAGRLAFGSGGAGAVADRPAPKL